MTGTKRGFSRERHTEMKVAITVGALAAFVVAWIGFSTSHGTAAAPPAPPTEAPSAPAETPTTSRGTRNVVPQATPTPRRSVPTPIPPVTRPRTSRGS